MSVAPPVMAHLSPAANGFSTQTYVVTNTSDNNGVNPAVGQGTGTLRQAIVDADASSASAVNITFALPETSETSTDTIQLKADLPAISRNVNLNATPPTPHADQWIILDGSKYSQGGTSGTGLEITGSSATVTYLTFENFKYGIKIENGSGNSLQGDFIESGIGQDDILIKGGSGNVVQDTVGGVCGKDGIEINNSANNLIGGPTFGEGNDFYQQRNGAAVALENDSTGNVVEINTLGGDQYGVLVDASSAFNTVSNNVFSLCVNACVEIQGQLNAVDGNTLSDAADGIVVGNYSNSVTNNEIITCQEGIVLTTFDSIAASHTIVTGNSVFENSGTDIDIQQGTLNTIGTAAAPNTLGISGTGNNLYGITVEGNYNSGVNKVLSGSTEILGVYSTGTGNSFFEA
jgi:hypothetical protein